jgi:tryptophanyl-tRNA synthetase
MSLQDPNKKMSKSDPNQNASVFLFDSPDVITKKIMSAVTDSGAEIKASPEKLGVTNLLGIIAEFSEMDISEAEKLFDGKSYGDFKKTVAEVIVEKLGPLQQRYAEIRGDDEKLLETLREGAEKAKAISGKKLEAVYGKVGFIK